MSSTITRDFLTLPTRFRVSIVRSMGVLSELEIDKLLNPLAEAEVLRVFFHRVSEGNLQEKLKIEVSEAKSQFKGYG